MMVAFSLPAALDDIAKKRVGLKDVHAIITTTRYRTLQDAIANEGRVYESLLRKLWPRLLQPRLLCSAGYGHPTVPTWAEVNSIQEAFVLLDRRNDAGDPLYADTPIPARMAHLWTLQQEQAAG